MSAYTHASSTPLPHGEDIEQSTDVTTEWAVFPNQYNVLVPGLKVHVVSHLGRTRHV